MGVARRRDTLHKPAQSPGNSFRRTRRPRIVLDSHRMSTNTDVPALRIGPAGWQYPDWNGIVYPAKRARDFDALVYIANYFNLVEINSSFYRIPTPATARSWTSRVSFRPDFTFAVKAHQSFTHAPAPPSATDVDAFRRAVTPMFDAGRMAFVLVQYPWSFKNLPANRARVQKMVRALAPFPVAVEVRHGSWEDRDALERIVASGATVCGIDQPLIGQSLGPRWHRSGPGGAYFRFHGRNYREWFREDGNRDTRYDYLYKEEELRPWVDTIARALAGGTPAAVVLNNHFRGQAPANAFMMMSLLGKTRVPAPPTLIRAHRVIEPYTEAAPMGAPWEPGTLFDTNESAAED